MKASNERLMIATLKVSQWYPRKFDREASDKVAEIYGSANAAEVGRFNKILVSLESIKPLQRGIREMIKDHYRLTAPWDDLGKRCLPAALYLEYVEAMQNHREKIDRLADQFVADEYATQRALAKVRLGGLFREEDYPDPEVVRARFGVRWRFSPLPNPEDARVWGIGDQAAAAIESDLRSSLEEQVREAQSDVVDQVVRRAREFVEKVSAYDRGDTQKLFGSAVSNLADVAGLVLRGLNVTGDLELEKVAKDLDAAISGINADQLKNGEGLRRQKVAEVEQALGRFQGVFGS